MRRFIQINNDKLCNIFNVIYARMTDKYFITDKRNISVSGTLMTLWSTKCYHAIHVLGTKSYTKLQNKIYGGKTRFNPSCLFLCVQKLCTSFACFYFCFAYFFGYFTVFNNISVTQAGSFLAIFSGNNQYYTLFLRDKNTKAKYQRLKVIVTLVTTRPQRRLYFCYSHENL